MGVPEIFEVLCNRLVEIQLFRTVVKDSAKEEFARFSKFADQDVESNSEISPFVSSQVMLFQDLRTGHIKRYGFSQSTAEHRRDLIAKHKNRQYGWLLVEAYEEFEDFLERIYAYIGKSDRNAWPLEDFGRVKLPELDERSFEWYLHTVRRKYGLKHNELLNRIRDLYPDLRSVEEKNICHVNLRVAIELIANLRHRIVHSRGNVNDLDAFVKQILMNCGLWNNGNPNPELRQFIEMFIHNHSEESIVFLSERRAAPSEIPLDIYYDKWGYLIEYLIAYAYSIAACVEPFETQPHSAPK